MLSPLSTATSTKAQVVPTSAFYSTIYSQAESRRAARLQARQRLKKDPELAAQVGGWGA